MSDEMLDKISALAEDMFYRKEDNEEPYVLLLGSAITMTSRVVREIVGGDDWESFFHVLNQMSCTQRRRKLEKLWEQEQLDLPTGYYALATMIKAGYFNPIITLNLDTYLDDALDEVGIKSRERVILTYGARTEAVRQRGTGKLIMQDETTAREIADVLQSPPSNKTAILRLYGSLDIDDFPLYNDMFNLDMTIADELPNVLSRELVMVGDNGDRDGEISEALERMGGTIWYVNPASPTYTYVSMPLKSRGSNLVTGEYGAFTRFFTTLEQELRKVDAAAFAGVKPSAPPVVASLPEEISEYVDLELTVSQGAAGHYPVTIRAEGRAISGDLALDPYDSEFEDMLDGLDEEPGEEFLIDFGNWLFQHLFAGDIRDFYRDSFARVDKEGRKLRVRLSIQPPEISALPWEYLNDKTRDLFLAVGDDVVLTRYVQVFESIRPLTVTPPLRILVVISNPTNLADLGLADLNVEKEKRLIRDALSDLAQTGQVQVEYMDHAVASEIRDKLREYKPHIFHFIGHGGFKEDKGRLVLEDERYQHRLVSDRVFREFFTGVDSTVLVVLNACQGGTISSARAMAGVAPNLVQRGIPAVVAMQYEIPDVVAIKFAREFYSALADYVPVDAAVSAARRAIYMDFGTDGRDWGTPVLFMRAPDGVIFAK